MLITRAVKQLATLELITTRKDGVKIMIEGTENGQALFEQCIPHLLNPVRKWSYVDNDELPPDLPFAGETALGEYTMLSASHFDEIVMIEPWFIKNKETVKVRFPKISARMLPYADSLTTTSLSLGVAGMFMLICVVTITAYMT